MKQMSSRLRGCLTGHVPSSSLTVWCHLPLQFLSGTSHAWPLRASEFATWFSLQHFIMEKYNTEKVNAIYSKYPYAHYPDSTINVLLCLLYYASTPLFSHRLILAFFFLAKHPWCVEVLGPETELAPQQWLTPQWWQFPRPPGNSHQAFLLWIMLSVLSLNQLWIFPSVFSLKSLRDLHFTINWFIWGCRFDPRPRLLG